MMHQNHNCMDFTQLKELPFWHFRCWHLTQHKGIFPNTKKLILSTRKIYSKASQAEELYMHDSCLTSHKTSYSCDAEAELHFRKCLHSCYTTCLISRTQNFQSISSIFSAFVQANMVCVWGCKTGALGEQIKILKGFCKSSMCSLWQDFPAQLEQCSGNSEVT